MISQEVSDLLYPWLVPVSCALMLTAWIANLLRHISRLDRENRRLRGMIVEREGMNIFAED